MKGGNIMSIIFSNLIYLIARIGVLVCLLALIEINYHVAEDLSRRRRLRWQEYLSDGTENIIDWTLCFVLCWPGLFIGDLGKEKVTEK